MNFVWFLLVAGGAAALGGGIAYGMFKQNPNRTTFALGGAAVVTAMAIGLSVLISGVPDTAPSNAPDQQGTHYDGPARPSDQNALPGAGQPNR
jgi:hypothetical protein